jgi:hypothetical protein
MSNNLINQYQTVIKVIGDTLTQWGTYNLYSLLLRWSNLVGCEYFDFRISFIDCVSYSLSVSFWADGKEWKVWEESGEENISV